MTAIKKAIESISSSISILLIEDSMEDGAIITKACIEETMNYDLRIIRKYTLEGGLEHLKSSSVDIVLLDLALPDARELKAVTTIHNAYPHIPIVIISGYSNPSMVQKALESGAQEFLIKGESNPPVIRQSIYQALARKRIELEYKKGERL